MISHRIKVHTFNLVLFSARLYDIVLNQESNSTEN